MSVCTANSGWAEQSVRAQESDQAIAYAAVAVNFTVCAKARRETLFRWRALMRRKGCLEAGRKHVSDIMMYNLRNIFTAASLETDLGWFPRQSESVMFLRKYSVRVKPSKSYKNVTWLRVWRRVCSLLSEMKQSTEKALVPSVRVLSSES